MTAPQHTPEANKKKARSKVGNGSALFPKDVDGRSSMARRMRDLIEDYSEQVGGDPSPAMMAVIRNAATLSALLEEAQADIILGKEVDDELFLKRCAMLSRLLGQLGLRRLARDVTPKSNGTPIDGHASVVRGDFGRG